MTILQIIFYVTGILFFSLKALSWIGEFISNILEWKEKNNETNN